MIPNETRPELRESLSEMLLTCKAVRYDPPKTFRQVCQWTAFFNCASRIYTRDGAGFQLDGLLLPYYERDKAAGILDDETAKFLIANLLLIDPHYYQISGVDENDCDRTNALSYLILEAADSINIACNLTVRVHENCDKAFLDKAVYYLLKNKNGWPRFCNDKTLAEGYMRNGVDKKTARERIAVGCNWMCVPGREFPMNDTVKINIAKVLDEALKDLRNEKEPSTAALFALYKKHLSKAVEVTAAGINLHLDHAEEVTPELIMNLMMLRSLETGTDSSRCAELYTIGVDGAGLAVVADSFGALEQRVEKEKILTWDEVFAALDSNFADERTRLILSSSDKYCSGGSLADEWAKKLTESWVSAIKGQEMPKNRTLVPGWFSWSRTIEYGKKVGATPNGRRAGEPISHGANPNPHFRRYGAVERDRVGPVRLREHRALADRIRPDGQYRKRRRRACAESHRRSFCRRRNADQHKRSRQRKNLEGKRKPRSLSRSCRAGNGIYRLFCKPVARIPKACRRSVSCGHVKQQRVPLTFGQRDSFRKKEKRGGFRLRAFFTIRIFRIFSPFRESKVRIPRRPAHRPRRSFRFRNF